MSTPRPFFDLRTPDYYRSLPLHSLFTRARASSLPRFVAGSAPAVAIDQQRQRASTPSASPVVSAPPSFSNITTPVPTPTSSAQSSRRSASPSHTTPLTGLPALNFDATASSSDPDSSSTTSVSQNRPARSVSFATVTDEHSKPGQPSLFGDIKQHRFSHRNNTDARLTFRLHEQLRIVLPSLTTTATQRLCYFSTLLYCQRTPTHL
jgi:hypothetical protein